MQCKAKVMKLLAYPFDNWKGAAHRKVWEALSFTV